MTPHSPARPPAAATSVPTSAYRCPACERRGDRSEPACATCLGLGEIWLIDELRRYPGTLQRVLADLAVACGAGQFLPGARLVECDGRPRVVYGTNDGVRLAELTAVELGRVRCRVERSVQVPLFDIDGVRGSQLNALEVEQVAMSTRSDSVCRSAATPPRSGQRSCR